MIKDKVVELLCQHGFRSLKQPVRIAEIAFEFSATLVGPHESQSLTMILDDEGSSLAAAGKRIDALAISLERLGSARSLTIVIVSENPDTQVIKELELLGRVLLLSSDLSLSVALRTLLPLELPPPITPSVSAETAILKELESLPKAMSSRLLKAARESADKVRSTMHAIIESEIGNIND